MHSFQRRNDRAELSSNNTRSQRATIRSSYEKEFPSCLFYICVLARRFRDVSQGVWHNLAGPNMLKQNPSNTARQAATGMELLTRHGVGVFHSTGMHSTDIVVGESETDVTRCAHSGHFSACPHNERTGPCSFTALFGNKAYTHQDGFYQVVQWGDTCYKETRKGKQGICRKVVQWCERATAWVHSSPTCMGQQTPRRFRQAITYIKQCHRTICKEMQTWTQGLNIGHSAQEACIIMTATQNQMLTPSWHETMPCHPLALFTTGAMLHSCTVE